MYLNIIRYFEIYMFIKLQNVEQIIEIRGVLYIGQIHIHLLFTILTTSQDLPEGN